MRASKRRKIAEDEDIEAETKEQIDEADDLRNNGLGGAKWECLAVTFSDLNTFIAELGRSRDPNEKILCEQLKDHLLPILSKQEESRQRKILQRERELLNMEKLATAKRSSRIAGRQEQQRQEQEIRDEELRRSTELAMARKEQDKWQKLERERESRMMTREQRVKEREARRILHLEDLANLSEDSKKVDAGESRSSSRHIQAEIKKRQKEIDELTEDGDWIFDCICGAYGQVDDGSHSIACDVCNIWQHSKCVGVQESDAESPDFSFICVTCKRRAEEKDKETSNPPIKSKLETLALHQADGNDNDFKSSRDQPDRDISGLSNSATGESPAKKVTYPKMHTFQTTDRSPQSTMGVDCGSRTEPSKTNVTLNGASGQESTNGLSSGNKLNADHHITQPALTKPSGSTIFDVINHQTPSQSPVRPTQHSTPNYRNGFATPSLPRPDIGMRSSPSKSAQADIRRNSLDHSSPTFGGPILTPANYSTIHQPYSANRPMSRGYSSTSQNMLQTHGSPQLSHATPFATSGIHQINGRYQDNIQPSPLPPSSTGISPIKHSPSRPAALVGSFQATTPSVLPPVAPLTPSPQVQNLAPPVKSSPPVPLRHIYESSYGRQE